MFQICAYNEIMRYKDFSMAWK